MLRYFRRRRPQRRATAPLVSTRDRLIAAHWGFTETQWAALPEKVKAAKRDQVVWAGK